MENLNSSQSSKWSFKKISLIYLGVFIVGIILIVIGLNIGEAGLGVFIPGLYISLITLCLFLLHLTIYLFNARKNSAWIVLALLILIIYFVFL